MDIVAIRISKNMVIKHFIGFEVTDPSTYASYLLLKKQYKKLDRSYDWRYLMIAKRTFLRHQRKDGVWHCHYCGKTVTVMAKRKERGRNTKCITVDHKTPVCQHEDVSDSTNFVCSCYKCNQNKGSMPYENYIRKNHTI